MAIFQKRVGVVASIGSYVTQGRPENGYVWIQGPERLVVNCREVPLVQDIEMGFPDMPGSVDKLRAGVQASGGMLGIYNQGEDFLRVECGRHSELVPAGYAIIIPFQDLHRYKQIYINFGKRSHDEFPCKIQLDVEDLEWL